MHHNGGLSLGIQITPFAYRGIGWKKQEGLKEKPHKNFLKKPPNTRSVNTLLTFWGDHMG
jgi:hypothetical protein